MPNVKQRNAFGVEFTAPELIAASGRTSATVRTMMRDAHGDMEEVCEKLGLGDADKLMSALDVIRTTVQDEETRIATEQICEILGIVDDDDDAADTVEAETENEEQEHDGDERRACVNDYDVLIAYRNAFDAVSALSDVLTENGKEDDAVFAEQMQMLAGLIEARCWSDFYQYVRMDWGKLSELVRANCI